MYRFCPLPEIVSLDCSHLGLPTTLLQVCQYVLGMYLEGHLGLQTR